MVFSFDPLLFPPSTPPSTLPAGRAMVVVAAKATTAEVVGLPATERAGDRAKSLRHGDGRG